MKMHLPVRVCVRVCVRVQEEKGGFSLLFF